jgi:hypothetical protein
MLRKRCNLSARWQRHVDYDTFVDNPQQLLAARILAQEPLTPEPCTSTRSPVVGSEDTTSLLSGPRTAHHPLPWLAAAWATQSSLPTASLTPCFSVKLPGPDRTFRARIWRLGGLAGCCAVIALFSEDPSVSFLLLLSLLFCRFPLLQKSREPSIQLLATKHGWKDRHYSTVGHNVLLDASIENLLIV